MGQMSVLDHNPSSGLAIINNTVLQKVLCCYRNGKKNVQGVIELHIFNKINKMGKLGGSKTFD